MLAVGLTWKMCFPVRMLLGTDREGLEAHLPEGLLFCCLLPNTEGCRDWAALPAVSYLPESSSEGARAEARVILAFLPLGLLGLGMCQSQFTFAFKNV